MEGDRVALKEPLLLELGFVESNTKGRISEVVVLLLLSPPYQPVIITGALRINLPSRVASEVLEPGLFRTTHHL